MNDKDPVDMLRELANAQRLALGEPAEAQLQSPRRRRSGRARAVWVSAALVIVGGLGGAVTWAVTRHEHPKNPTQIACHQTADLDSSQVLVPSSGADPVEQCTTAWIQLEPDWGSPPPMVACVSVTQIAVVFPGDAATCGTLGLANFDPAGDVSDQALINFEDDLTDEMASMDCVAPEDARALVMRRLVDSSLEGWSVVVADGFSDAQPCAALGFDPASRIVEITALPNIFG